MYLPEQFKETRVECLHGLIRDYPLALLVMNGAEGLRADLLPFEVDPEPAPYGTLLAHVAHANPVWQSFEPDSRALIVFQGPQAPVSPSWYPSKLESARVVPTWNYIVTQARGVPRAVHDPAWLRRLVERLTNRHEASRPHPWRVSDAPPAYIDALLQAIVGVEIPLTHLVGKWKVSQNKEVADRMGVAAGLEALDQPQCTALAAWVRKHCPHGNA